MISNSKTGRGLVVLLGATFAFGLAGGCSDSESKSKAFCNAAQEALPMMRGQVNFTKQERATIPGSLDRMQKTRPADLGTSQADLDFLLAASRQFLAGGDTRSLDHKRLGKTGAAVFKYMATRCGNRFLATTTVPSTTTQP